MVQQFNPFTVNQSLAPTQGPTTQSGGIDWNLMAMLLGGVADTVTEGRTAPLSKNINQYIGAKSQTSFLQRLLAGEIAGAKLTADDKGMSINIPKSEATKLMGEGGGLSATQPLSQSQNLQAPSYGVSANPFGQGQADLGNVSLAGLSSNDITNAFGLMLQGRQLDQQTYRNVIDAMYKQSLMDKYKAETKDLNTPFPVEVPGIGNVTTKQWNALPREDQEYALFVQVSKKLGDKDIMSKREWQMLEPTERERFLRSAMEDPELMSAAKELASSGAMRISIGEKVNTALAMSKISGEKYFNDPRWIDDIDKYLSSPSVQMSWFGAENETQEKAVAAAEYIENKITAGSGKVVDIKWDGKTIVWKVRWPSGNIKELRYAVSD